MSGNSLVSFMDKDDISRRDLKLEKLSEFQFNQSNEDSWTVFPNCDKCNVGKFVITIPNKNPILQAHSVKFPNCDKCNPETEDHPAKFLFWETVY